MPFLQDPPAPSMKLTQLIQAVDGWRWPHKLLVIGVGYLLAVLAGALTLVLLDVWHGDDPAVIASSGMTAFADAVLALGVTGLLSLPPSAVAVLALRRLPWYVWAGALLAWGLLVLGLWS